MIRSTGMPATEQAAKRFTPRGGVIMPGARFSTMIRPKCHRGSTAIGHGNGPQRIGGEADEDRGRVPR